MLQKPYLANCNNRHILPKVHPSSGTPEEWLSNHSLINHGLLGINFDFFVNWGQTPFQVTPVIWIKRILNTQYGYDAIIANIRQAMSVEFGESYLRRVLGFTTKHFLELQFIVFRDDLPWNDPKSQVLIVSAGQTDQGDLFFNPNLITRDRFMELIKKYSGGPVRIGSKGLILGTSSLECYLSQTDSLYPGDADLVLIDDNNSPKAIIEFKKHTLATPIADQQLTNYYPNPDGRKYNRLAALKDYLSRKDNQVPLIIVYYPTQPQFKIGKIELLQGNYGTLATRASATFNLPTDHSLTEYDKVVTRLERAIAYHYRPE